MGNATEQIAQIVKNKQDQRWIEVLTDAAAGFGANAAGSLFLEHRSDAVVELDGRGARPLVSTTTSAGLSADAADGDLLFQADPGLDDPARLVGAIRDGDWPEARAIRQERPEVSSDLELDEAVRLVERLVGTAERSRSALRAKARWVAFEQSVMVVRAGKPVATDLRRGRRLHLRVELQLRGKRASATAEAAIRGEDDAELQRMLDLLADEAATRVEYRLGAELPAGRSCAVAFAPGVGGVLMHEIVGHAAEADAVASGNSWLQRARGQFRGAVEAMVVDDPRRGRAPWRVDDDGMPPRVTALLREGLPADCLHDLRSATEAGVRGNGHGRRSSYREPVRPRMGCTFLAAGRHPGGMAVLEGLKHGIYIRRMESATTDTRLGRATFVVTDSDRVSHGRIVAPLQPYVIAVDGAAALTSIADVGEDLAFDRCIGSCVHHGQPLAVSVGAPTFRIGPVELMY